VRRRRIADMIGGTGERIRLRLTVVDPSRAGAQVDVEVSAPAGARLASVASDLYATVGHPLGAGASARPRPARGLGTVTAGPRPGLFVDGEPVDDAVVGLPPLVQGAVVTVARAGGPAGRGAGTCGGLAEVHVVAGPDAGTRLPLPQGTTRIGRGCEAGLRLADPDVSRVHAEVVADGTSVRVRDLGSTNGTRLAGAALEAEPVGWPPGQLLEIGGSLLTLRSPDGADTGGGGPASTVPDAAGHLLVNPAPRLRPPPLGGVVTYPEPAPQIPLPRLPWPALVLPLLLSVPLAWWLGQPAFFAFALLSPVMMLGQYLFDRRQRSGEQAGAAAGYASELARVRAELAELLAAERARLLLDHPDPAAVAAAAAGPLRRLWERRPGDDDEARLRLGLGSRRPSAQVRGSPPPADDPPRLTDVPVTIDLADPGVGAVVGLTGPRRGTLALARCLVGQAAVACSPHHLRLVVLTATGDRHDWAWAAWLPHAGDRLPPPDAGDRLPPTASAGTGGTGEDRPAGPRTLLVLDGAARLRRDPRVAALLACAGGRLHVLCLDDEAARLPAECRTTVEVAPVGAEPGAVLTSRGEPPQPLRPDLVSPAWAERLARDLARLADATPAGPQATLPNQVRLLDLLDPDGLAASALARAWSARRAGHERATSAVVGVTTAGPWRLDLARHGPHALVAGTTGAGKSELLTALVCGLATTHPPDRVNLLLVDYKGGTAFGPLADLPHTAGVLTDLDEHLARRALSSLRAELRRREGVLRATGAPDLEAYDHRRGPGDPPLPRLVIVVDEFRVLAEELPELLTGLVRVAVVGRSLGVHLVLATQRPAGVVTAEIRANVNLRIALRVRDRMDSEDVVDAPDAAFLPPDRPGRGLFRVGGGPLVEFQAALATGRPASASEPARVQRVQRDRFVATSWRAEASVPDPVASAPPAGDSGAGAARQGPDDLATLVGVCRRAALQDGTEPARAPWLPPLPPVVTPDDLPALLADAAAGHDPHASGSGLPLTIEDAAAGHDPHAPGGLSLTIGVTDLPEQQTRARLRWVPSDQGHLAVIGAPGSGRTGVLRAIAGAACRSHRPVHVHVIDATGALGDVTALPRVGSVVPAADAGRAGRLLDLLRERGRRGRAGADRPPALLLVDGWEQLLDSWLPVDHGRLVDDLVRLARDGAAAGVRIAVTGGRGLLSGPLPGLLTERLLLRTADPGDLVLAGVPASSLPVGMPSGRAVRVLPGGQVVEAQVLLDDPVADDACRVRRAGEPAPFRLLPVPDHVRAAALLAAAGARPGGIAAALDVLLPIGLGGDDAAPLGPPGRGPGWLVAGQPGSGRSTALACAARVLLAAGREIVVVAAASSPLAAVAGHVTGDLVPPPALRTGSIDLAALLDRRPGATVLLDDVSLVTDTLAEDHLLTRLDEAAGPYGPGDTGPSRDTGPPGNSDPPGSHAGSPAPRRWPAGPGPHVLAGCTPAQAAVAFRGLAARLRGTGAALLTAPVGPGDGEAFGVRVPAVSGAPPGRALLVTAAGVRILQVADPEPGRVPAEPQAPRLPESDHG
jgi:S-DNA-T family DNA segregation ATPase FtsK/SpoIIIE